MANIHSSICVPSEADENEFHNSIVVHECCAAISSSYMYIIS